MTTACHDEEDVVLVECLRTMDPAYGVGEWTPFLRRLGYLTTESFFSAFETLSPDVTAGIKTADLAPVLASLKEKCSEWADEPDAVCLKSRMCARARAPVPSLCPARPA